MSQGATSAWDTHSQPTRVDSAYWNGAVGQWQLPQQVPYVRLFFVRSICGSLHLLQFFGLPHPSCAMSSSNQASQFAPLGGIKPRETDSAPRNNVCKSRGLSNNGRRWSHVIPGGPPAARRLADLTFQQKSVSSRLKVETPMESQALDFWEHPASSALVSTWRQFLVPTLHLSLTTRRELSQLQKFQDTQRAPLVIIVIHTPSTTSRCCGGFFNTHDAGLNKTFHPWRTCQTC